MDTLAILGGGKIGEALLSGLLRGERDAGRHRRRARSTRSARATSPTPTA